MNHDDLYYAVCETTDLPGEHMKLAVICWDICKLQDNDDDIELWALRTYKHLRMAGVLISNEILELKPKHKKARLNLIMNTL